MYRLVWYGFERLGLGLLDKRFWLCLEINCRERERERGARGATRARKQEELPEPRSQKLFGRFPLHQLIYKNDGFHNAN
jgi:hypothetical protein